MPSPKYSLGLKTTREFTLPSGNTCLIQDLDPTALIAAGILDSMDSLTAIVQDELLAKPGAKPAPEDDIELIRRLAKSGQLLTSLRVIDLIVELAVAEPVVRRPVRPKEDGTEQPLTPAQRQTIKEQADGPLFFTDEIDPDDKNAIVEDAMKGVKAVEPFRAEPKAALDNVENV
jgi:hypothetical protein